jgi:hypothetical protein
MLPDGSVYSCVHKREISVICVTTLYGRQKDTPELYPPTASNKGPRDANILGVLYFETIFLEISNNF